MNNVQSQWDNLHLPEPDKPRSTGKNQNADRNGMIVLPSGDVTITDCAEKLFGFIAPTQTMFLRVDALVELRQDHQGRLSLAVLKPTAFRSRIEKFGTVMAWRKGANNELVLKPVPCSEDTAKALMASDAARRVLPRISLIVDCPIMVETGGGVTVLRQGFHPDHSGILVTRDAVAPIIEPHLAAKLLQWLVGEFDFQSPGDRTRAIAAIITPALKMGGLIKERVPLIILEADQSQAGKTYFQKIIAALYGEIPTMIAQRNGGVGSVDESFAQALANGRPFILLDNFRGKLDSPYIESFMTATGDFGARVPYCPEVTVTPDRVIVMMTSNGVETTPDLANRSCIIRIRKQNGFQYRQYHEGGLLEYIKANQGWLLGCIFSMVKAWHQNGTPRKDIAGHDYREWAQVLDWIVRACGLGPLLVDHRQAQERVSNPALAFVRSLAIALKAEGGLGKEYSASDLAALCCDANLEIPGVKNSDNIARAQRIGTLMKSASKSQEKFRIDSFEVTVIQSSKVRNDGGGTYSAKSYRFFESTA